MEAMRAGKPIVATTVGEIPMFIQNDMTGLTVPPHDANALSDVLQTLLRDDTLRARLGAAAKKKVEQYSLENYMRSFEALVTELYDARTKN